MAGVPARLHRRGAGGAAGRRAGQAPAAGSSSPWLDYAVELGCNGLLLGPVFASQTHGYDTIDHFRIDPRLGDEGDFDALVAAADARGLRLILDGVFNHVGRRFPPFQAALHGGPATPAARWFKRAADGDYAVFEGHTSSSSSTTTSPRCSATSSR